MKRHKEYWSVRYEGYALINRYTSCDVPAALNQPRTTVFNVSRSIFPPTSLVVSSPESKYFLRIFLAAL